jgi:hypothetical protein
MIGVEASVVGNSCAVLQQLTEREGLAGAWGVEVEEAFFC